MKAERIALGAMCVVLMTLPFAHSIAVRNVALAVALVSAAFTWRTLVTARPPLLWFFVGLAALGGLSLAWSIDPAYSRGELKPELLYPPVVFVLFFALCRDRVALAWCGAATAAAIVLSAAGPIVAWIDWDMGRPGRGRLYSGAGFHSTWLVIAYPFALAAGLSARLAPRWRQIALGTALVALVAGYATLNRTFPYVAIAETLAIVAWAFARGARAERMLCAAVGTVAVIVLAGGWLLVNQQRQAPLPKEDQETIASVQRDVRWVLWSEAVERIAAQPLRGAGFGRGILRHELPKRSGNTFLWHAHNTPLNWGLQMGLPGVALLLALFATALWHLARAYRVADEDLRPFIVAAMVVVIGVFLKNQTDDFFVRQTVLAFWAALGAVLGASARVRPVP